MAKIAFTPEIQFTPEVSFTPEKIDFTSTRKGFLQPTPGVQPSDIAKQASIGFINEALLGFPLFALEKGVSPEARKRLESEATPERIARGVGTTAGFFLQRFLLVL
ncbi:unnamed protein product, partial [marine sediment metagenome]